MPRSLKIGLSVGYFRWLWMVFCRFEGFRVKAITDASKIWCHLTKFLINIYRDVKQFSFLCIYHRGSGRVHQGFSDIRNQSVRERHPNRNVSKPDIP